MATAKEFVKKIQSAYYSKWGYIWGTRGELWTAAKQEKATRAQTKSYGAKWIGHYVADCSGLVKWALIQIGKDCPHGSNSIWSNSLKDKGDLNNGARTDGKPILPGTLVFKRNGTDIYHVGVYVGDGYVIEAQSTQAGVVRSKINRWALWGELKVLDYGGEQTVPNDISSEKQAKVIGGTLNVRTYESTSSPKVAQLANGSKVEVESVNGDWAKIKIEGYVMKKFLD